MSHPNNKRSDSELAHRVHAMRCSIVALRAKRWNESWPVGHADRNRELYRIKRFDPTGYAAVKSVEDAFGPGCMGADEAVRRTACGETFRIVPLDDAREQG